MKQPIPNHQIWQHFECPSAVSDGEPKEDWKQHQQEKQKRREDWKQH